MKSFLFLIVIVVLAAAAVAFSGVYNVAASEPHGGFAQWFLSAVSEASIERHSEDIEVPDLQSLDMRLAGINDFDSMCAECHTPPGRRDTPLAMGLNPPAPDLAEEAEEMSPAELFWVTKNGIRMTGMPAWGASHSDDEIWPVIAFLQDLPELDGTEYTLMLKEAAGMGHHGGSQDED